MIMYNSFILVTIICYTISNYPHAISSTVITSDRNNLINYNNDYYLSMIHTVGVQIQSLLTCTPTGSSISQECCIDVNYWLASIAVYANATATIATCGNDTVCIDKYSKIIGNNLFAIQEIDAFGKIPSGILAGNTKWAGAWEECNEISSIVPNDGRIYNAQFSWIWLALQSIGNATCDLNQNPNMLQWSVCMPISCTENDIKSIVNTVRLLIDHSNSTALPICAVQIQPLHNDVTKSGWIMASVLIFFCALSIISSAVDYYWHWKMNFEHRNVQFNTLMKLLISFSIYTNGAEILDTSVKPGQINCVHCIRVFSLLWVILGHSFELEFQSDNVAQMFDLPKKFINQSIVNGVYSVDNFFFLGGLLLSYLWFKEMRKDRRQFRSPMTWFLYYLHRVVRLTPPYLLIIGVYATLLHKFVGGPYQYLTTPVQELCRKNWWQNALYINNFFDLDKQCYAISWYLSMDMQIHIFAPILLIPLFISPIIGSIVGLILLAGSMTITYVNYYKYHFYAASLLTQPVDPDMTTIPLAFYKYIYMATWIRFTPYLVGVFTGYLLQTVKTPPRMNKLLVMLIVIIMWCLALSIGMACVFGLIRYAQGEQLSIFWRATYQAWSRPAYALALSWIVIACHYGYAGPIGDIMSLKLWIPLGKLSYCAYLLHQLFMAVVSVSNSQQYHFSGQFDTIIHQMIPLAVLSYGVAFFWSAILELPFQKIEKTLIEKLTSTKNVRQAANNHIHEIANGGHAVEKMNPNL